MHIVRGVHSYLLEEDASSQGEISHQPLGKQKKFVTFTDVLQETHVKYYQKQIHVEKNDMCHGLNIYHQTRA